MIHLKPYKNRLLARRHNSEVSIGGIIYTNPEKSNWATIFAVGDLKSEISVGDIVYITAYAGFEYEPGHLILKEDEVLAYVPKYIEFNDNDIEV